MARVTLTSTVPLTAFAQDHLDKLRFDSEAPLERPTEIFEQLKPNCLRKAIINIYFSNSTVSRVIAIAVVVFLAISLIGIPVIFLLKRERDKIATDHFAKEKILEQLNAKVNKINMRAQVIEQLGLHNLDRIPVLTLQGKPEVAHMLASVMKWAGSTGEGAFIFLKMQNAEAKKFLVEIFETNVGNSWSWSHNRELIAYRHLMRQRLPLSFFKRIIAGETIEGCKLV